MKWFILIVMTFAPPKPDYDSMVVTTKDNNLMIFGSYGKCYTYIHNALEMGNHRLSCPKPPCTKFRDLLEMTVIG